MYCTTLAIYGSKRYPLLLGSIYESIAELYTLPGVEILIGSLHRDVHWPDFPENKLQVYFLEDMLGQTQEEKAVFQIRFSTSLKSRELTSLFISIQRSEVKNMTIQFPGRSGRGSFSRVLAAMKSVAHTLNVPAGDLEFEASGFPEVGLATSIREHSLSAFVWIEGLQRYLHVRENPSQISDVRKGRRSL